MPAAPESAPYRVPTRRSLGAHPRSLSNPSLAKPPPREATVGWRLGKIGGYQRQEQTDPAQYDQPEWYADPISATIPNQTRGPIRDTRNRPRQGGPVRRGFRVLQDYVAEQRQRPVPTSGLAKTLATVDTAPLQEPSQPAEVSDRRTWCRKCSRVRLANAMVSSEARVPAKVIVSFGIEGGPVARPAGERDA